MRTFSMLPAAALLTTAFVSGLSTPAAATSCVAVGDRTPHALVTGTESREQGSPTYLRTDGLYAVVGTVTGVETDEDIWGQGGRTEVEVDVDAVFGTPPDPNADLSTVTVTELDPGWMNGYAFEPGTRYFIPLAYEGPDGMQNYSFVCDPIGEVTHPQRLIDAAREGGVVEVHVPDEQAPAQQRTGTETTSTESQPVDSSAVPPSGGGFPFLPVGAALAGLAVAGALLRRWARLSGYRHAHGAGPA